jgi:hypothetical protein
MLNKEPICFINIKNVVHIQEMVAPRTHGERRLSAEGTLPKFLGESKLSFRGDGATPPVIGHCIHVCWSISLTCICPCSCVLSMSFTHVAYVWYHIRDTC